MAGCLSPGEATWLPMLGEEGIRGVRWELARTASDPALPLSVRSASATALAGVDEGAAAEALSAGLDARDEEDRLRLLGHLTAFPGEASRRWLDRIALTDPSERVRATAGIYLGSP